jgi:hypothetical protein
MPVSDYMRDIDIQAFKDAAARYHAWILVRESNFSAKQYIGVKGYAPKRLDCKAKTAQYDVKLPGGLGEKRTAGLVVNPTIKGLLGAFKKPENALKWWNEFSGLCYFPEPGKNLLWFPGGKFYSVQMDPAHVHYGCVLFSPISNRAAACYIHSDYDLFAIVPEDEPTVNYRVKEKRLGKDHTRSKMLFDVQHFLNRRMGVAMILHGEQETFSGDLNDTLDVFCPDGWTILRRKGALEIRQLYDEVFEGRQLYGLDANPIPAGGLWEAVVATRR